MKRFKKYLVFIIVLFFSFYIIPAECFSYTSRDRVIPQVWVIDTTYNGHGEAVADVIRRQAPNANIVEEFIPSNNGAVLSSEVASRIDKAVNEGADIINLSLGASYICRTLQGAIERAQKAGVTIVAASGNDGRINYPAALDGVISVGANDYTTGRKANYSSPADVYRSDTANYKGRFYRGTSFAAPRVTGEIANAMYKNNTNSQAAAEYVTGRSYRDTSYASNTSSNLKRALVVDENVLLRLFVLAIVFQKFFFDTAQESYFSNSYNNNNIQYERPSFGDRDSTRYHKINSGFRSILASELR